MFFDPGVNGYSIAHTARTCLSSSSHALRWHPACLPEPALALNGAPWYCYGTWELVQPRCQGPRWLLDSARR